MKKFPNYEILMKNYNVNTYFYLEKVMTHRFINSDIKQRESNNNQKYG